MLGLIEGGSSAELLHGVLYQPYLVAVTSLAALVVWLLPNSWDWTQRLTPIRAACCLGLFCLSLLMMETQVYSPFIYFAF